MKKILAFLLALFTVLSFAACNGNPEEPTTTMPQVTEPEETPGVDVPGNNDEKPANNGMGWIIAVVIIVVLAGGGVAAFLIIRKKKQQ